MKNISAYDQGCVELIQNSFSDYFQGNVDFDKAKPTNSEFIVTVADKLRLEYSKKY